MPPSTRWSDEEDEKLTRLHGSKLVTTDEMAVILGRSPAAVKSRIKLLGIGSKAAPATEKMCPGCGEPFMGKAASCSRSCGAKVRARRTKGRVNARGSKSGKRADLDGLFVRSSWEANYARYLNLLQSEGSVLRWEYEPKVFRFPVKRGNKSYTPDFRVWITDTTYEWHEVKGWMDNDSRIKLQRFALHFPEESLLLKLIDRKVYQAIAADHATTLENWE